MTTKLDGPLKRELTIDGKPYTVTLDPHGFRLVEKGRRNGYELDWKAFLSGEAALATALNASLAKVPTERSAATKKTGTGKAGARKAR